MKYFISSKTRLVKRLSQSVALELTAGIETCRGYVVNLVSNLAKEKCRGYVVNFFFLPSYSFNQSKSDTIGRRTIFVIP